MRKFWSTMMAAAGIGAAAYGLSRYRNGKYMQPVQSMLNNAKDMFQNAGSSANNNPLMEISKELAPNNLINKGKKNRNRHPINPS
ncbi:hypothetical protein D4T97_014575 [Siminovitchia acidinfaciens]|uniref:Uncharacterized protein n=1 Tax=Siminovitchia acidinfaciens TaxID=2321395 RepID=A0A429XX77_9BACI|nr:hypothetical protein [Siminovitchia acidinfaciens]RST73101.1 hypothetical protein D4T97_014575 [Siminovitchia acidinfaciens]